MAIQYGSTAVNAIKYCNALGMVRDVMSVVRNGIEIFDVSGRTDNNGVWKDADSSLPPEDLFTLTWNNSLHLFRDEDNLMNLVFDGSSWVVTFDDAPSYRFYASGNNKSTTLDYQSELATTLVWSAS